MRRIFKRGTFRRISRGSYRPRKRHYRRAVARRLRRRR